MTEPAPFTLATPLPPLRRDLEIMPYEHEGRSVFVLADPEAEHDRATALSPGGLAAATLFDGRRTAEQVSQGIAKELGSTVPAGDILSLARQLEESGLLETEAARARRQARLDAFLRSPTRKAQFLGPTGYPAEALKLTAYLDELAVHPKGPGTPAKPAGPPAPAIGLISPHIDLNRGGPAYAWAYGALAGTPAPDVIVALGVAHASPNSPWVLTRKDYETPLGPVRVDAALYDEVKAALWYDPLDDEWVHRREHSLEFQALWLRHIWKDKTPAWLPVLCSTFERFSGEAPPTGVPTVEQALQAIAQILKRRAKTQRVLVLAGVDLAHVGPRFGDDLELTPELERKLESEDRATLDAALSLDADAFYRSAVKDGHWRKICGLSALYTALRWIKPLSGGARGELLTYGQAPDPAGGIVSFAGGVFR